MSVNYTRINWEDSPSTQTPLNAENLNAMDSAIDDLAGAVNDLDGVPEDVEDLQTEIGALKNDLNQFPNGTYPNMSVGNADQLTATVGIEDTAPYLFRTSGGSNDIGDREDVRKIVGGTIVNNQLLDTSGFVSGITSNVTFTNNNDGSITVDGTASAVVYKTLATYQTIIGHKYLLKGCPSGGSSQTYQFAVDGNIGAVEYGNGCIYQSTVSVSNAMAVVRNGVTVTNLKYIPQLCDITLDFGTSIADYVYSLETATAGAGVAWLKKHFPKQFDSGYQAYDAGSLQSVSGLTEHRMVGFNQWDEEYEVGAFNQYGTPSGVLDRIMSKNFIPVVPNSTYCIKAPVTVFFYIFFNADKNSISSTIQQTAVNNTYNTFTTPQNARYMKFYLTSAYGTTYKNDVCINFHWDGEKDGTYEPYKTWSYALDDSVVTRGIPKVDANGNLYYDGDEYLPDGTVNRRYGIVDLGTLNWETFNSTRSIYRAIVSDLKMVSDSILPNIICPKYMTVTGSASWVSGQISTTTTANQYVFICDTNYETASAFKTAMSGVMLVYELTTPTTETALPYQETQIVDDFGTEEFVLADGAFPVPVGHDTMYQNNLRAKLEMSPESPDGDGLYVVQQESGENTYVPLASTATIQDILTRLTALENA